MAGIATHYVPSDRLDDLYSKISELDNSNMELVNQVIIVSR
jgi:hypothetical protein